MGKSEYRARRKVVRSNSWGFKPDTDIVPKFFPRTWSDKWCASLGPNRQLTLTTQSKWEFWGVKPDTDTDTKFYDPEVLLHTPKPRKIQRHQKVTQKWVSGPRPKWLKGYLQVTQKRLKSWFFRPFDPLFESLFKWLLSHFGRGPESRVSVTFLCLSIFRGFGVCRSTSGSQT